VTGFLRAVTHTGMVLSEVAGDKMGRGKRGNRKRRSR
jgi:hypothetical protein